MLRRFNTETDRPDFSTRYPLEDVDGETRETVTSILGDVRETGWQAVCEYSRQFDDVTPDDSAVDSQGFQDAWETLGAEQQEAFAVARERIVRYQTAIKPSSTTISDGADGKLGEIIRPLETVGCYIPGGRFPLPSTVLMTALVAEVAGVENILICSPPAADDGRPHESILAASSLLDSVRVFAIGGVQAVGAMAYGAGPVPSVDLVAGPGNLYVTLAKKQVYGRVDIDMLAGPSEICVIAEEGECKPAWVAADLLSQAEHDPDSRVYALTPSEQLNDDIEESLRRELDDHPNPDPVREALHDSALITTSDLDEAILLSNELAPEHLELHVGHPDRIAGRCRNAGAIFCGQFSPEPLGDYTAGPSHTLPTGGTARFFSPLSVRTFLKSQSLIATERDGFDGLKQSTSTLASLESLHAHRRSVETRDEDV